MAKKLGADHCIKVDSRDPNVMAKKIEDAFGEQPTVTIECSGAEPSVQTGIFVSIH